MNHFFTKDSNSPPTRATNLIGLLQNYKKPLLIFYCFCIAFLSMVHFCIQKGSLLHPKGFTSAPEIWLGTSLVLAYQPLPYKKILSKPTVLFPVPYRFRTVFRLLPVRATKNPLKHGEPFLYEAYSSVFFTKLPIRHHKRLKTMLPRLEQ